MHRRVWHVLAVTGALAGGVVRCVGNTTVATQDAGPDVDTTGTAGHACFANGSCDQGLTCVSPNVCVILDAGSDAPPDATFDYLCTTASNCGTNVCCATVNTSGNVPCTVDGASSMCTSAAACITSIPLMCSVETVRLCTHNDDCSEPNYDQCCTVPSFSTSLSFCWTQGYAAAVGGSCLSSE